MGNLNKTECVVLFSGGLDSLAGTLWAKEHWANKDILALYVNLGTKYTSEELAAVDKLTELLDVNYQVLDMPFLSSYENWIGHIPMRNIFLLELAALYGNHVVFGMLSKELSEDKGPKFKHLMQKLFDSQTQKNFYHDKFRIKIETPFETMTKTETVKWILSRTRSWRLLETSIGCMNSKACGECISCFNRWIAFENNGLYSVDTYSGRHPARWGISRLTKQGAFNGKNFSLYSLHISPWHKRKHIWEIYKAYNSAYRRNLITQKPLEILKNVIFSKERN